MGMFWYAWQKHEGDMVVLENAKPTLAEVEALLKDAYYPKPSDYCIRMGMRHAALIIETTDPDEWESKTDFGRLSLDGLVKKVNYYDFK